MEFADALVHRRPLAFIVSKYFEIKSSQICPNVLAILPTQYW
jgi:hypothetical protein